MQFRGKMSWTVASVRLKLVDGTTVIVERDDLRRVYEGLWTLSNAPGAVSTAALLLDEGGNTAATRRPST
jgi:hypothetical protein